MTVSIPANAPESSPFADFGSAPEPVVAVPSETLTGSPLDADDPDNEPVEQTLASHTDNGPRALRPYQTQAVGKVHEAWNGGESRVSVVLPTGTGKELADDTPIPVPGGFRLLRDIEVGDDVIGPQGRAVEVIGTFDNGVQPVWRVVFSDGSSVLAGAGHLWEVTDSAGHRRVLTTAQIQNIGLRGGSRSRGWRFHIPMTAPVRHPWIPRALGTLEMPGDVTRRRSPDPYDENLPEAAPLSLGHRATAATSTLERVVRAPAHPLRNRDRAGAGKVLTPAACEPAYQIGMKITAGVPVPANVLAQWMCGPVEGRVTLLAGILDGGMRMVSRRVMARVPTLYGPMVNELVASLGGTAGTSNSHTGKGKVLIRVHLPSGVRVPTRSRRLPRPLSEPNRAIVAIEEAGTAVTRCLSVDHPKGLFLCGRDYIVTHNSTVIAKVATDARSRGEKALLLAHREELLEQMAAACEAVDPGGQEIGFVAADRDDPGKDIVVASFQTLSRSPKRLAALGKRDVILADECFPAGTLIGGVPIEDIEVGDLVPSWDQVTETFVQRRVVKTTVARAFALVRVRFGRGDELCCTPRHPFLTDDGWEPAADLLRKSVVSDGLDAEPVTGVERLTPTEDGTFGGVCPDGLVYNLEVEGTHTYLVNGLVVHNCHHISAPTYVKVLEDLGAMDDASGVRSCGFTATMHRDDGKALGEVWSKVVFERDFAWAVKNGFLVPPKGKTVAVEGLNQLGSVHIRAGDYARNELEEVMAASVDSTVDAVQRHCPPGAAMIVFAVSVSHAQALAEKLTGVGIRSEVITGEHKREHRKAVYADYHSGKLDALVTVAVLTEGADFPRCDTVVMARPTRSKVLLSQCIGRAVRLYTDPITGREKTVATVLDLTGVTRDMKMASLTDLWPQAEREFFDEDGDKIDEDTGPSTGVLVNERQGPLTLEDIDLLGPQMQAHIREVLWLSTDPAITGGSPTAANSEILFLPTRDPFSYMFIWPPLDQMNTAQVTLGKLDRTGRADLWSDANGSPVVGTLQQAMDAAESVAGRKECISRKAGWRRPQVRPTESQIKTAHALGVPDPENLSRGQISDRLSTIFASRAFANMLTSVRR